MDGRSLEEVTSNLLLTSVVRKRSPHRKRSNQGIAQMDDLCTPEPNGLPRGTAPSSL